MLTIERFYSSAEEVSSCFSAGKTATEFHIEFTAPEDGGLSLRIAVSSWEAFVKLLTLINEAGNSMLELAGPAPAKDRT